MDGIFIHFLLLLLVFTTVALLFIIRVVPRVEGVVGLNVQILLTTLLCLVLFDIFIRFKWNIYKPRLFVYIKTIVDLDNIGRHYCYKYRIYVYCMPTTVARKISELL